MRTNGIAAVALVALMTMAFTGMATAVSDNASPNAGGNGEGGEKGNGDRPDNPGSFGLNQSVIFGERVVVNDVNYGIFTDGSLIDVDATYYNPNPDELPEDPDDDFWWNGEMYSEVVTAQADWSDNLVLHKWAAGGKIRTEVLLSDIEDPSVAVFTIRATFLIEYFDTGVGEAGEYVYVWGGATINGLWVDQQPENFYSAEVNQLGMLLYGYNWDTDGCEAGKYRLTFSIDPSAREDYPGTYEEDPAAGNLIECNDITIGKMVDPDMYAPEGDEPSENYSLLDCDYDTDLDGTTWTWIEIELL